MSRKSMPFFFPIQLPTKRLSQISRLSYGSLEARQLLAVITVDTTSMIADGSIDGEISLGEAIVATNTNAAFGDAPAGDSTGDRIHFDSSLTDSTITLEGSALSITDDLVIQGADTNVTISGGEQSRIFSIATSDDVVLTNLNIVDGKAFEGGALFIHGGGKVSLYRVDFANNYASHLRSGGGAIFNVSSQIFATEVTFTNNVAAGYGGAIFSADGELFLYQSKLTGNHAQLSGGGILAVQGGYYLNQTEFIRNTVITIPDPNADTDGSPFGESVEKSFDGRSGGAVSFSGSAATSVILTSTFDRNTAEGNGGALSLLSGNRVFIYANSSFSRNVSSSHDTSEFGGGGIYSVDSSLNIGNATFTANIAANGSVGGAILSKSGFLRIYNTHFNENVATRHGGGVAILDSYAYINTGRFRSNTAGFKPLGVGGDISHQAPSGGGLYIGSGDASYASLFNTLFQFNSSFQNGGAIANAGRVLIAGNSFIGGNTAFFTDGAIPFGGGGGIYNTGPLLRVYSSTIQNNEVKEMWATGGGIYSDNGNVEIGFSSINLNRSGTHGGGLALVGGSASLFDTRVEDNTASSSSDHISTTNGVGGGIYVGGKFFNGSPSSASLTIVGGSISNNSAVSRGGGLFAGLGTRVAIRSSIGLDSASIRGNRALQGNGGGLAADHSELEIRDALFADNSARSGGGLSIVDASSSIFDSTIRNNSARIQGGGLYQVRIQSLLDNTSVFDNVAPVDPNIASIP